MKSLLRLIALTGFGLGAAAACGDDSSSNAGSGAKGGGAGHSGGAAGLAGKSAHGGSSTTAGTGPQSGTGGGGGRAGAAHAGSSTGESAGTTASGGRGGTAGRGGKGGLGGSAGHATGSGGNESLGGAGSDAGGANGGAGETGAPMCAAATAENWRDATPSNLKDVAGVFETELSSSAVTSPPALIVLGVLLPDTGTFTLGTNADANYSTCDRCLLVREHAAGADDRFFFASSGTLYIHPSSDVIHGVITAELTDVTMTEVTIDPDTVVSTPVPDGECFHIASSELTVPSEPDGAGGAAGTGGSGGTGGTGGTVGTGEGGAAGAPTIPDGCAEIQPGSIFYAFTSTADPNYGGYLAFVSPNLGSADEDVMALEFYTNDTGTFEFGKGVNKVFSTCEQCFTVNVPDGSNSGRNFYGISGTVVVDPTSAPSSKVLDATVTDVTLIEVQSDFDTPVPGGDCLHLASASISLP
jgi:hypothetical protein